MFFDTFLILRYLLFKAGFSFGICQTVAFCAVAVSAEQLFVFIAFSAAFAFWNDVVNLQVLIPKMVSAYFAVSHLSAVKYPFDVGADGNAVLPFGKSLFIGIPMMNFHK